MDPSNDTGTELITVPFDISLAPEALQVDDAPSQDLIRRISDSVLTSEQRVRAEFFEKPKTRLRLEYLRDLFNDKRARVAMASLNTRSSINIDPTVSTSFTRTTDPSLSWSIREFFVDLLICIGNNIGLHAFIPNAEIMYNFEIEFQINNRNRQFSAKYAKLGFDPIGAMQWVGRSSWSEDIWIAWVPTDDENINDIPAGQISGSTIMSNTHFKISIIFFALMLKRSYIEDITLNTDYPDLDDEDEYMASTNLQYVFLWLTGKPRVNLNLTRGKISFGIIFMLIMVV
jgi:hypothetical protein